MKKLNAAIIGCGAIHQIHADAIQSSEHAQLYAVADIDEQKASKAGSQYHCKYYTDYKVMLENENIDVVHICTPHYLHAPMAVDAVKAGKHVLVEKPVALNVQQALHMLEEVKKHDRFVAVSFQNRYNNTSVKVKEILDSGQLGKILGIKGIVTWHRDVPYYTESGWRGRFETEGGGVLINQAIHTLDLMQWFGGEVEAIKGHVDTRVLDQVIEVEDTADATLYFKDGAVGVFYATNCHTTNSPVEIEIHCEKGTLRIVDGELLMLQDGRKECIASDHHNGAYKDYWGTSHKKLIDHFYQCILEQDEEDYITAEQGIEALKLLKGIYDSSSKGEKMKINTDNFI